MAEFIELRLERMMPELEQMKRLKLYDDQEIVIIIKRRKEFEYKIGRRTKQKQDFLNYINYETKLIRNIKLRRDKHRISEKKSDIEYAIVKRVIKMYKVALKYFKSEVNLWLSYIDFCTQVKFANPVSEAIKDMLQVHGDKVHLWQYAARWELEESKNLDGALNLLKTGLHHHPNSKELYLEAFRLELKKGSIEKELESKSVLRAEVYFKTSVKIINNVEYVICLLNVASEFNFTEELQTQISDYLTGNYWESEKMWETMAQRELDGFHYDKDAKGKSKLQMCISVYKSAVKILPKDLMWHKYMDKLIELHKTDTHNRFLNETVEDTLEEACNGGYLLEEHFKYWISIEDESKHLQIWTKATESLPQSVDLWLCLLKYYLVRDEILARKTFQKATSKLQQESLPLYKYLIEYYISKSAGFSKLDAIFQEGLSLHVELRPLYLEYLLKTKNLKYTRNEFKKLAQLTPYSLELHQKMLQIETNRSDHNLDSIRTIHKFACEQFGKNKTEVWINYMKFEMTSGDPKLISVIYNNGRNNLDESLLDEFSSQFTLVNSSLI